MMLFKLLYESVLEAAAVLGAFEDPSLELCHSHYWSLKNWIVLFHVSWTDRTFGCWVLMDFSK